MASSSASTAQQEFLLTPFPYNSADLFFCTVDKIIEFVPGKKAVGLKTVTTNEEFFNGHFPERPIMPGVLQVEAMAQVGGMIALQQPITDGNGDFFFAGVNNIKWRRPVVPGDTLVMQMELTAFKPRFGLVKMKGSSYVDGQKVVEGDFQVRRRASRRLTPHLSASLGLPRPPSITLCHPLVSPSLSLSL